jgi:alkyl sulfatase BDS1-like metallo-beta-lactamase superfamily hydrolase
MHNLLTPRGAKVRNAKAFGDAIDEAMQIADDYLGGDIQVLLGTHHWPTWGNEACRDMMSKQRDMYYYFNNQVIHMLNKGMNMTEIAEEFALPASLSNEYYNRGYYGTINHNVKAVAQFYTGWWDGNPANYFTYPEAEEAKRFVADMGGEEAVLGKAHEYFKKGDYRWTVELTKQLVFNNPQNKEARYLQADALEQLGYSFEAGTWRNIFLAGASDLRTGGLSGALSTEQTIQIMAGNMRVMQPAFIFDYFAILLDGSKAGADNADYAVTVKIADAYYQLHLYNGVLHAKKVDADASAIVFDSVSAFVDDFAARMRALNVKENTNTVEKSALDNIYQYFELFDAGWNIVEPLK